MLFQPHLTPVEMLKRGVFGKNYFACATAEDIRGMSPEVMGCSLDERHPFDKRWNDYGVKAGESYENWLANGWIFPEDPLGWFHWYCRYHNGRRHLRDDHQIRRWQRYGIRWGRFARTQLITKGDASPVVKQGLLQWGYDPMKVLHDRDGV
jgi:hypothetical protein